MREQSKDDISLRVLFVSSCSPLFALHPPCRPSLTRLLMPVATTPSASPRPSTLVKMDDRKRPAISGAEDLAPPSKRVAINGSKAKDDNTDMKEETWIEVSVA